MRPWHPVRSFVLPALVLGLVVGCGGGGAGVTGGSSRRNNTPPTVTGVSVNSTSATLVRYKSYTLTAQTTDPDIGDSISRYDWDFGSGEKYSTTSPSLQHAFTKSGTQSVLVQAFDAAGAASPWATFSTTVDASLSPITLTFTSPSGALNLQADLGGYIDVVYGVHAVTTGSAPVTSAGINFNPGDPAGAVIARQDNGGGDFTITVRYQAGSVLGTRTFTPTVSATDATGIASDLVTGPAMTLKTLSSVNTAPILTVTNPASLTSSGFTTKPVSLDFLVKDADGDAVTYSVDWGDGTPVIRGISTGDTKAGVTVSLTHAFPDSFTSTSKTTIVRVNATDSRSSNGNAIEQSRTFTILYNTYPTATITSPQASATLPTNAQITGSLPAGFVNPPGASDADIVVIPNGGKLAFNSTATPPGSGDAGLTYSWTFQNGTPATSNSQNAGEVIFNVAPGTTVPQLVELKVTDAFGRLSSNSPTASAKSYRKWVVVDAVNTQNFSLSYMFRQKSDNNGTVALTPAKTAANGFGSSIQIFQDGVTNTYQVQDAAGRALVSVPVRSNLPFYAKLASFGGDTRNYLLRIPNAPTGTYADPGFGTVLKPNGSSFGFQNGSAPFNPQLQIVTGEGFAPESGNASERRIQGVVGSGMVIGSTPGNNRYLDRLAVPLLSGDSLGAFQWAQGSNVVAGFENIRANQSFGEWVALWLNMAPKDALTTELPIDADSSSPGTSTDFGLILDYAAFAGDSAKSKSFAQNRLEAFRVPPGSTDPYDMNVAGWDTSATTVDLNPTQISSTVGTFYENMIFGALGATPLAGGIQTFSVPYDANDPNRAPYSPRSYGFAGIRQVFSYAEYLWSSVWARPVVLNRAHLSYLDSDNSVSLPSDPGKISNYAYFRKSNPSAWPAKSGITPDGSGFNMNVSGAGTFDPSVAPVSTSGAAPSNGVGRFYWTAFTPFYGIASGTAISRTWLSDGSGLPPTTFPGGGSGDATSALGFVPPQDVVVDKRGRNANGTLNGQPLGGYRITWFNPTKDSSGSTVPPDFWVVEVNSGGNTYHFALPANFPSGTQSTSDLILTDARTFLPSGNAPSAGPAAGGTDTVAPGYCWFDLPSELRPSVLTPSQSATIMVFAVKSILKNQPPTGARTLTPADWIDAIKTVTANVKVSTNAGEITYAHKVPFNFYWDIVVVNGPKTFVAP